MFRAQNITLNMETQDITLGGNVKGKVTESKKEEKNEPEPDESEKSAESDETEADENAENNTGSAEE